MAKLYELAAEEFLNRLASDAPAPGGGGGAAMAGALAAALASMVANLTIGKEKFAAQEAECKELLRQAEALRQEFLQLVEADARVFDAFMACYKLPKVTEEDKARRAAAIADAAKQAAGVPLAMALAAVKTLALADRLAVIGNPGLVTDAACSAILARASLRCAAYNVLINLKLTKDEAFNGGALAQLADAQKQAEALEKKTLVVADALL